MKNGIQHSHSSKMSVFTLQGEQIYVRISFFSPKKKAITTKTKFLLFFFHIESIVFRSTYIIKCENLYALHFLFFMIRIGISQVNPAYVTSTVLEYFAL